MTKKNVQRVNTSLPDMADQNLSASISNQKTDVPVRATKRGTTGKKHEDKLSAILRTAAQLFADNGYEATSLDTIADRLGMHKATLYHYVKGKENILYQCLLRSFSDLDKVLEQMEDRSTPPLTRLRIFARHLAYAQNNDFGRCLVQVGIRPLAASGNDIKKFQKRLDNAVRSLVTEGIANASIKPCNPALVSALLFGALNWVPHWYKEGQALGLDQVVDAFMDMISNGIAGPQQS